MEEKYLYTIAIVVIFAGFLFTSVGTYTGRPVIDVAESLEADYSSTPGSSSSGVFENCDEGNQRTTRMSEYGEYEECINGAWRIKYCHPGEVALPRVQSNKVVCAE
ncbi:MAG: hypothetical protein AABY10_02890 [Nanoarchaeota archaeon]